MSQSSKLFAISMLAVAVTACARLSRVEVSPHQVSLTSAGQVETLKVKGLDQSGNPMQKVTFVFESADPAIASVDSDGRVTAVSSGATRITVTAADKHESVDVDVRIPARIEVTPPSVSLTAVGATADLSAKVLDHAGRALEGVQPVFTVDNAAVATVSGRTVTAVGAGAATVRASVGTVAGTVEVKVEPPAVAAVELSNPSVTLKVGAESMVQASFKDATGAEIAGVTGAWTSRDIAVATVDNGKIVAVAPGKTEVTVSVGERTAVVKVVVKK